MIGSFICRLLKAALLPAALLGVAPSANAETIRNTATASWRDGGGPREAESNTVSFERTTLQVEVDTFHVVPDGPVELQLRATRCQLSRKAVSSNQAPTAATFSVSSTDTYHVGENIIFKFAIPVANRDPGTIDSLLVRVTSDTGDSEDLLVYEDGPDTGDFIGSIRTTQASAAPVSDDCVLSVRANGSATIAAIDLTGDDVVAWAAVNLLADPFGMVFDSETGMPISGSRVTLVEAASGRPATVLSEDGLTSWPSTIVSGQTVTDGAGIAHPMEAGQYRFPLVGLGSYKLIVEPPSPYAAPSRASPAELALLSRPGGGQFQISGASFGSAFTLTDANPFIADLPLDAPGVGLVVTKTASRQRAQPGDAVFYTVTVLNPDPSRSSRAVTLTDLPSPFLRLRPDSVRIDGAVPARPASFAPDGQQMQLQLGAIPPGSTIRISYAATVRADASAGDADNLARITDDRGLSASSSAAVRIDRDVIAGRMTLIGRVTANACVDGQGIPGVRVMLEDGSFSVTDADGRYHFEGLLPGTHVVQAAAQTLPEGSRFVDCKQSTRSAGAANSQFVTGQGGSLTVADFTARLPTNLTSTAEDSLLSPALNAAASDRAAAGAEADWLSAGPGPTDWLFPSIEHNPRAPATRVVIRHAPGETVELTIDGAPVDPLAFDGARTAASGDYAVSVWRGVPLQEGANRLRAVVRTRDGGVSADLSRTIYFTSTPARIELLSEQSRLVADGSSRPVIALRVLDRHGRPVRAGISGRLQINEPYESARALDAMQLGQVAGNAGSTPTWVVEGDAGIARVELAPTMVSGPLQLDFSFSEGDMRREQRIDAWVVPGEQQWTLVGLAEGSVGARTVAENMEREADFDSDLGENVRVALYAKGRILGRYLLTIAYDSAKPKEDQRLLGTLDPNAYYTVFADGSVRRFDAPSREKLYVRLESRAFYAIYGDFQSGIDQTELARYDRTLTGVKAEGTFGGLHVQAFAAETVTRHWRDEIQGSGLSGPYSLSSRAIVPNSEKVAIEVRDRFRSEIIVSRRELVRFVDYDLDLLTGSIRFREPVLSRDFDFNPQFIVVDYELASNRNNGLWNGAVRTDYTFAEGAVRVGATAISDQDGNDRTNVGAVDVRARLGKGTELRAELAGSRKLGTTTAAWLVEAEHHDGKLDVLGYARSVGSDFGVGQESGAERGRRKLGVDARYNIDETWSVGVSAWQDDSTTDLARRRALEVRTLRRSESTDLRLGFSHFDDRLQDGRNARSTILEGGVAQRFLDQRLELELATSLALQDTESIDLPSRHRIGARYAVTQDVRLIGSYEIAEGDAIDARTVSGGVELSPWTGGKVVSSIGRNDVAEFGKRSFAAFGLSQSFNVTPNLMVDFTVDGSRTLGNPLQAPLNSAHPVASGGHLGSGVDPFEDFTAVTLGGAWRKDLWSVTLRGEYRDGSSADRKGIAFGAIRQMGDGVVVGSGFTWTAAKTVGGAETRIFDGGISAAFRPTSSEFAALAKLEYRSDEVRGAVLGDTGGAGRTALTVSGDATSRRLVGSLSTNWSPRGNEANETVQRTEIAVFIGGRYGLDSYEDFDLAGVSGLLGADARIGIGEKFEVGATATVRSNFSDGTVSYAVGPQIGFTPVEGVLLTVGYNFAGFRDDDFAAMRSTDRGVYAGVKMKFDAGLLSSLGIGR